MAIHDHYDGAIRSIVARAMRTRVNGRPMRTAYLVVSPKANGTSDLYIGTFAKNMLLSDEKMSAKEILRVLDQFPIGTTMSFWRKMAAIPLIDGPLGRSSTKSPEG